MNIILYVKLVKREEKITPPDTLQKDVHRSFIKLK